MGRLLLHCIGFGCEHCKNAKKMGKKRPGLFQGKKMMYTCEHYPKEHESVYATGCMHFKCGNRGEYSLCDTCRG